MSGDGGWGEALFGPGFWSAAPMTDTWPRAKQIAQHIVSDWMLLEADERKMDTLVGFIEEELDKALTYGMRISHAVILEQAAKTAEDYDGLGILEDDAALTCNEIAAAIRASVIVIPPHTTLK